MSVMTIPTTAQPPARRLTWHEARSMTAMERLVHYSVRTESGCLVFTGATTKGYGIFQADGRTARVHEWAWEQNSGPLEYGLHLHHLCSAKPCWEHEHLLLLPAADHLRLHDLSGMGAVNAAKISCMRGHPLEGGNLYVDPLGKRRCRECRNAAWRRMYARRTA